VSELKRITGKERRKRQRSE